MQFREIKITKMMYFNKVFCKKECTLLIAIIILLDLSKLKKKKKIEKEYFSHIHPPNSSIGED